MADVKWVKITTDIFDNMKIKQIKRMPEGRTIIVIWFELICLAGSINADGQLLLTPEIPFTDQMLASQFGETVENVQLALEVFRRFEMIEIIDNVISLPSWAKYQNVDGLEKVREQARLRKQRYTERKKLEDKEACGNVTGNVTENVAVTQCSYSISNSNPSPSSSVSNKGKKKKRNNINDNLKVLDNILSNNTELSDTLNNLGLLDITKKWMTYKNERKDYLQETSIKTLVNKIIDSANEYSVKAVISVINDSVSAGYVGIVWDKLKKAGSSGSAYIDAIKNRNNDIASWDLSDVAERMGFE